MSIPVHGNYHGYYSKRPSLKDARLALLPAAIFKGACVLDVGCNEGFVTCEIAQSFGASKVVGVDIDDTLIRAAWKRRRTVWSLQGRNNLSDPTLDSENHRKRKRNPSSTLSTVTQMDYFPASCEHMFGPLPILPSAMEGDHSFPHNVSFRTADWVENEIPEDADGYDVVIAFSISKWIHLNGGDSALTKFFQRVHSVLRPKGTFVLEPQAWDTYGKAKRMDRRLKENAKGLKLRPEEFDPLLQTIGFHPAQHFGVAGDGGFRRPVDVYIKSS